MIVGLALSLVLAVAIIACGMVVAYRENTGLAWSWRWLIVEVDLPPMPARRAVVWGYWFRRTAQEEADLLQRVHKREHSPQMVRIDVVRRARNGREVAG